MGSSIQVSTEKRLPAGKMGFGVFAGLVLLLVGLGIVRSAIATRLDGFTLDEAYHIAAGVSYVKYGDFRINPEHPPLVKMWVGGVMAATGFHLGTLRQFTDKPDERRFTQTAVFRENDPDSVQRRARAAMFALNGLLLISLACALQRAFDARVALGMLLFLVIDPTVAAHLPVVMTDLPVALLSATAIVLATRALREWIWTDIVACGLFLGLALAAKHSAPVVLLGVTLIGAWLALRQAEKRAGEPRWRKLLKVAALFGMAMAILWGSYYFRYAETRGGQEACNRALADKIKDVDSPSYRAVLVGMAATHIVPRAYLWGFADTVHAGMEGRPYNQLFFGRVYLRRAPKYFFPAIMAVKLPLGLGALGLFGMALFFAGRLPPEWNHPAGVIFAACTLFLLVLAKGATYAGIRHALPVVVLFSIFAGLFVERVLAWKLRSLKAVAALAFVLAGWSAVPVLRPWEYFNEFVGMKNAYRNFSDEGVDLGQRSKELAGYYQKYLKASGEIPDVQYWTAVQELDGRGIDYLGRDRERDRPRTRQPERKGTIFVGPIFLLPGPYWNRVALRETTPAARFGNLLVYRGAFSLPGNAASELYHEGVRKLYAAAPDQAQAEEDFQASVELDPKAFFVHIELGNLRLMRGRKEGALRAYQAALENAPEDEEIRQSIERQIQLVTNPSSKNILPLRDPHLE